MLMNITEAGLTVPLQAEASGERCSGMSLWFSRQQALCAVILICSTLLLYVCSLGRESQQNRKLRCYIPIPNVHVTLHKVQNNISLFTPAK